MDEALKLLLQSIEGKIDDLGSDVKDLRTSIKGNGVPGIDQRVHDLEQEHLRQQNYWKWFAGATIAMVGVLTKFVVDALLSVFRG